MKFFGKEIPPRKSDIGETAESQDSMESQIGKWSPRDLGEPIPPEEGPLFRRKPVEALAIDSLVEKARSSGQPLAMVEELDQFYDAWVHYAQDRNVFNGSPAIRALAQARREAIKLANDGKYDELRDKLEELSSKVSEVEAAAEKNLKYIQSGEITSSEYRKDLASGIHEIASLQSSKTIPEESEFNKAVPLPEDKDDWFADHKISSRKDDVLELTEEMAAAARRTDAKERMLGPDVAKPASEKTDQVQDTAELALKRSERHTEREARADRIAQKYDIVAERTQLLEAENKYASAIQERNANFFSLKRRDKKATREQQEELELAIEKWRAALAQAGEKAEHEGSAQDRIAIRFISARDSMMRIEQVRQDAVAAGLDERSKSVLGKVDTWANKLNSRFLAAGGWAADKFGKVSEAVGGTVVGLVLDKETDAGKYQRASRIVGSAAIMTAIFAPFGAAAAGAAGLNFVWRTARGLGGWGLGSAAGAAAGKLHDLRYGPKEDREEFHKMSQMDLRDILKGKGHFAANELHQASAKDLAWLYKKGSRTEFKKQEEKLETSRARAQLGASALVAGISAYGLSNLPHVHDALTTVGAGPVASAPAAHLPDHVTNHTSAGHVHAETHNTVPSHGTPAIESGPEAHHVEKVIVHGKVNDADKLFGKFIKNIQHEYPDPKSAPPALRSLLEQYHESSDGLDKQDVVTRFLHLQNGGSVVVHEGDSVSFENGKVLFQGHTLINEHGDVQNLRTGGEVHIQHPHEAHTSAHQQVEKPHAPPVNQSVAPEAGAPSTTEHTNHVTDTTGARGNVVPIRPGIVIPSHEDLTPHTGTNDIEHPTHTEPVHTTPSPPHIERVQPANPASMTPSNDNAPHVPENASATTEAPVTLDTHLNPNGFDLSKPSVGFDSHGNLFSHIVRSGDVAKDNELSYQTAVDYANKHHDSVVYFVDEKRNALGVSEYKVYALKYKPAAGTVAPFFPDEEHPYDMPPVPKDTELHKPSN